jgi:hypothetical protein
MGINGYQFITFREAADQPSLIKLRLDNQSHFNRKDAWENCVWSSKAVNSKKDNRLPHEAGHKLLKQPMAVREMPVTALIRNTHGIADWEPFVNKAQP